MKEERSHEVKNHHASHNATKQNILSSLETHHPQTQARDIKARWQRVKHQQNPSRYSLI